jgi:hypothetical protein
MLYIKEVCLFGFGCSNYFEFRRAKIYRFKYQFFVNYFNIYPFFLLKKYCVEQKIAYFCRPVKVESS